METVNYYKRICEYIDLDAVRHNISAMKANINENTRIMAVIKADGYGHGAEEIANILNDVDYIWGYGVATVDEAILLRKNSNVVKPILILGCVFADQIATAVANDLTFNIFNYELAKMISDEAVRQNRRVKVHIKMDTDMSRLGFLDTPECYETIARVAKLPNLYLEGCFSHLTRADEVVKDHSLSQITRFRAMIDKLDREYGIRFELHHISASAGIIDIREGNMDMVRAGISIYGLYPSEDVIKDNVKLKPVMSLISHVAFVKTVPKGTPVSYGGTYVTDKPTRIATIPVGYADGYPRLLSNKGYVLIKGQIAPILGRVCMDMFMVDVTDIPEVIEGDRVTLVGQDGERAIAVEDLSKLCGRFNYEFVCDIGKRAPRVFMENGVMKSCKDYFYHES